MCPQAEGIVVTWTVNGSKVPTTSTTDHTLVLNASECTAGCYVCHCSHYASSNMAFTVMHETGGKYYMYTTICMSILYAYIIIVTVVVPNKITII